MYYIYLVNILKSIEIIKDLIKSHILTVFNDQNIKKIFRTIKNGVTDLLKIH